MTISEILMAEIRKWVRGMNEDAARAVIQACEKAMVDTYEASSTFLTVSEEALKGATEISSRVRDSAEQITLPMQETGELAKRDFEKTCSVEAEEVVTLCPNCKAFQTILMVDGKLIPTRRFFQKDEQIFHDCGSNQPCRLYR